MNKNQQKLLSTVLCYFADMTVIAWFYYKATNYALYTRSVGGNLDSPDFQIQFYRILLQSLTFALLLFLAAQTLVYILSWRNFRAALLYLKLFCVFGFTLSAFISASSSFFGILPMGLYVFGYYVFAKRFKESSPVMATQTPPTPQ